MTDRLSRRALLRAAGIGSAVGLAGCTDLTGMALFDGSDRSASGTVADTDGDPVADAVVETLTAGSTVMDSTSSNDRGEFSIAVGETPAWVRVTHPEYSSRVRAVAPDTTVPIVLTPEADTASLMFGGDTMFGRRFQRDGPDDLRDRFRIQENEKLRDHRRALRYVEPVLREADVTSLNLETSLTRSPWRHPNKQFTFTSDPVAARALEEAGVDYVALGNNHVFDALEPGLADTIDALDSNGLRHSGAGFSSEEAWEPAMVTAGDLTIAYLSCSEITGKRYDIDWSADRGESSEHTVTGDEADAAVDPDASITFSGSSGVAEPTEDRLADRVASADERADVVVVQIHGGDEYSREPTEKMRTLVDAAVEAGADVVVNHHPHVTGGVEFRNGALVAWTMGNFVFDQELWETLRSYTLTVDVSEEGVERAVIDPVVIEGYLPKGVTRTVRDRIVWESAGLSADRFDVGEGQLEYRRTGGSDEEHTVRTLSGSGDIYARNAGWIEAVDDADSSVRLGRERLLTGRFENDVVSDERSDATLWRFDDERSPSGPGVGYGDGGGITLARNVGNDGRSFLSPIYRLPIGGEKLTFTCLYATDLDEGLDLEISWYNDTRGNSFASEHIEPGSTGGDWERLTVEFAPPADATFVDLFVYLYPPDVPMRRTASFSDMRLIEWADDAESSGRQYDHLQIDGTATIDVASDRPAPWESEPGWEPLEDP